MGSLDGGSLDGTGSGRLRIAVVGSGISGLSAAWLLSKRHDVTVYEKDARLGGHAHTVTVPAPEGRIAVDTGFIVFNPLNYPNLVALFEHLGVATAPSDMSFAVSMDGGTFEYGGSSFASLFAQRSNLVSPRFWSMLRDLVRFYRSAPEAIRRANGRDLTLGEFLRMHGYGDAFVTDHLLPMAGAIWSAAPSALNAYPAAAFVRFFENHGLLRLAGRPQWRTVQGGSLRYVEKLVADMAITARVGSPVRAITRHSQAVVIETDRETEQFDRILVASHADEALSMLTDPTDDERQVLSAFRYTRNRAVLHSDARLMPKRRAAWSSWNYIGQRRKQDGDIYVSYWMNRLQPLSTGQQLFLSLNPGVEPAPDAVLHDQVYTHPLFTQDALLAQPQLAKLQGRRNTWYCGAHFGSGFHEDGLKSGLDAAEAMGGAIRPWASGGNAPRDTAPARAGVHESVAQ